MPDPNWMPAYDIALTWNGTELPITTGESSETHAEFDTTNTKGDGATDFGVAEKTYSLRFSLPIDKNSDQRPATRDLVSGSWSDGITTYSGKGRILTRGQTGGGKGGSQASYTAKFAGPVVKSGGN